MLNWVLEFFLRKFFGIIVILIDWINEARVSKLLDYCKVEYSVEYRVIFSSTRVLEYSTFKFLHIHKS
jgi:hypothetical protein